MHDIRHTPHPRSRSPPIQNETSPTKTKTSCRGTLRLRFRLRPIVSLTTPPRTTSPHPSPYSFATPSSAQDPTRCMRSSRYVSSLSLSPTWSHHPNTKRSMMYADHGVNFTSPLSALARRERRPSRSKNSASDTCRPRDAKRWHAAVVYGGGTRRWHAMVARVSRTRKVSICFYWSRLPTAYCLRLLPHLIYCYSVYDRTVDYTSYRHAVSITLSPGEIRLVNTCFYKIEKHLSMDYQYQYQLTSLRSRGGEHELHFGV